MTDLKWNAKKVAIIMYSSALSLLPYGALLAWRYEEWKVASAFLFLWITMSSVLGIEDVKDDPKPPQIHRTQFNPGDTLVVTYRERMPYSYVRDFAQALKLKYPDNTIIALDNGAKLEVLGKDE